MRRRNALQGGYLRKEGSSWLVTYREYGLDAMGVRQKRRVSKNLGPSDVLTREEAERRARDVILRATTCDAKPIDMMTLGDFIKGSFFPQYVTLKQYGGQQHYRNMLKHWWPLYKTELRDLTAPAAQELLDVKARKLSTETVRKIKHALSAVLEHALRRGWEGRNIAKLLLIQRVTRVRRIPALTPEQVPVALRELPSPSLELATLGMALSLGVTEALGLQWIDLNLEDAPKVVIDEVLPARSLIVLRSVYKGRVGPPKNSRRVRVLPIPVRVVEMLKKRREGAKFARDEDFVFATSSGKTYSEDMLRSRQLKPAGERAGMPWLTWSVFRKTHATGFQAAGLPVLDMIATMGHSNYRTTFEHYVRGGSERSRESLETLWSFINPE